MQNKGIFWRVRGVSLLCVMQERVGSRRHRPGPWRPGTRQNHPSLASELMDEERPETDPAVSAVA